MAGSEHAGFREMQYGAVTVLAATNGGRYPFGNSLVIRGSGGSLLVDPSLSLRSPIADVDQVLISHAHEDHVAGLHLFDVPVYAHYADVESVRSVHTMIEAYGLPREERSEFEESLASHFTVPGRPDAVGLPDGIRFDLGDRAATVIHLPGHTPGHCGVLVEPDGFFYVSDIDLTSFGPFYGDAHSSLEDFGASIERCREIDARWYGTFHQKGVVEGRDEFLDQLSRYAAVIESREMRLLAMLDEPRSIADIADQRLVYRAHVEAPYVTSVERRTAQQHVARLRDKGMVAEVEPGLFRAVSG
ncbi:MBL fold metallo-hydrolase [Rhodococcus qingshengii]|uniref:MBL fold metallo-hydrolase n=1 Tax=Rhodococcus qingshengii TaxID=334542 RepID=UPI00237C7CF7|nr:MBL fold metallo-hydrolase [Rhodococcus qingshengii]WCT05775.1 MBL fold metallo-hydrolase [Rhodococcus qingshengii]